MRVVKLDKSKADNPLEDKFFEEYEGFEDFDDHCCDDDEDKLKLSDAMIAGLIMAGIFVSGVAFLSVVSYFSVKLFKKTATLIKN